MVGAPPWVRKTLLAALLLAICRGSLVAGVVPMIASREPGSGLPVYVAKREAARTASHRERSDFCSCELARRTNTYAPIKSHDVALLASTV